jgi:hypothetical protein
MSFAACADAADKQRSGLIERHHKKARQSGPESAQDLSGLLATGCADAD